MLQLRWERAKRSGPSSLGRAGSTYACRSLIPANRWADTLINRLLSICHWQLIPHWQDGGHFFFLTLIF